MKIQEMAQVDFNKYRSSAIVSRSPSSGGCMNCCSQCWTVQREVNFQKLGILELREFKLLVQWFFMCWHCTLFKLILAVFRMTLLRTLACYTSHLQTRTVNIVLLSEMFEQGNISPNIRHNVYIVHTVLYSKILEQGHTRIFPSHKSIAQPLLNINCILWNWVKRIALLLTLSIDQLICRALCVLYFIVNM